MKIFENGNVHNVMLRIWSNDECGWAFGGADSSDDVMRDSSIMKWSEEDDAFVLIDGETFDEWYGWWDEQCELYNKRDDSSWFVEGFDADELDAEWSLNREYILSEC